MIQQEVVRIPNYDNILFIHDDVQFVDLCNKCIEILNKVKDTGQANMHVYDVIAKTDNEYSVQVAAILSNTGQQLSSSIFIAYDELINVVGLDKDGCLDIVNLDEKTKFELQKFLIKRLWNYYKYGKKFFKA